MSKKTLAIAILWLVLAGGLFYAMDNVLHPNTASKLGESGAVVLQRGTDGHYRAEAFINGIKVDVLVDTGATDVAISKKLADILRINSVAAIRTVTANGSTVAYMTKLDTVKLGGIEVHDVPAIIPPNLDGDVLLGMSFLNRMDVRLYKGSMTITRVSD